MWNEVDKQRLINQFLPPDAMLLRLEEPNKSLAIITADLDGDRTHEIAAAYHWKGNNGIVILKWYKGYWYPIYYLTGKGYGITFLSAAPISGKDKLCLIAGWQQSPVYSELAVLEWTGNGFTSLLKDELFFSEIEVLNIPTINGFDDKYEIALWTKDSKSAYAVEVYHWSDNEFKPFPESYPYYFKKVVDYYQKQVIKLPDYPKYWYYLADAQTKAELYDKALSSIDIALKLDPDSPSWPIYDELKNVILQKLRGDFALHPAAVKTIEGTKWGYINNHGAFTIKPQFDYAMDFQDNNLAVVTEGLTGIIDIHGRYIIPPKYFDINPFSEGRAVVIDNDGFKLIDENGKFITSKAYEYIGTFHMGRAVVGDTTDQGQYLYGYLDRQGREIIPLQYQSANDFDANMALVKVKENQYALIGLNGERLHTYEQYTVNSLSEGLIAFQPNSESKFGYMDIEGNVVLQPKYSMALPFNEKRAVVNISEDYTNKFGLIDKEGNFIIQPIYNDINLIGQNKAALGKAIDPEQPYMGSLYAIADIASGKILTDFVYTNVLAYDHGYASVSNAINTYFIDEKGQPANSLPTVTGRGTLAFAGILIKADIDQRVYYLSKEGHIIWKSNQIIPLNYQYKIIEEKYSPNYNYLVYFPQIAGIKTETIQEDVNSELKDLSKVKPIEDTLPLNYSYSGDFNIQFYKKYLLVLKLDSYMYPFGAAHGMPDQIYAKIDLISGQFYQLKDLFKPGSNYVNILSEIIAKQIKEDPQYSYVFTDEYKGISEDQPFYVSEDSLYIYFAPYEIGPYAAGFPTFTINYSEISEIIDKEGSFWKSYH